ncbi:MAG: SbcC/MukB-like Walker B domain-containing protein, partial [Acidobacteriota bacterium]
KPEAAAFEDRLRRGRRDFEAAARAADALGALRRDAAARAAELPEAPESDSSAGAGTRGAAADSEPADADGLRRRLDRAFRDLDAARTVRELAADRLRRAVADGRDADAVDAESRDRLGRAIADSPFADADALRRALLSPEELERLRRELRRYDLDLERRRTELDGAAAELEAHDAGGEPEGDGERDALDAELADVRDRRRIFEKRRDELRYELQRDDERRRHRRALERDLEALRVDLERAARLSELIGQKDGGKFRRFAQQLNLDQLLGLANLRLERLAPRYALARLDGGLDLEVIDRDMADERRPTSTLSGGESFLVSLALALALADLRRGQLRLGTLFLDEGFGSLDEDTLETALATLEQLQAEQATQILIISHVGALQERIAHRIAVEKLGGGHSRLRLVTDDDAAIPF